MSFIAAITSINMAAAACAEEAVSIETTYPEVVAAIKATMRTHHYDPAELDTSGYQRIEAHLTTLGKDATSDEALVEGFRRTWRDGPFSHVSLSKVQQSADALADDLETMRVGDGGAMLTWQGDTAILALKTMMGLDTIEQIDAAYAEIADRETEALIIDLRENGGAAFI